MSEELVQPVRTTNCSVCRGACCEEVSLSVQSFEPLDDVSRWFLLHGHVEEGNLLLNCRCSKLTEMGRCAIYTERPQLCRDFEPGAPECLTVLRRRRTPEQQARILSQGEEFNDPQFDRDQAS